MNIALHYTEKGNKAPFILLHGNGEDNAYFKHQIEYFSDRYRVIALDTRGHGQSPRGTQPFTIEQFACDLYDFMTSHQMSNAVILGFSDGANIAMKFAMNHPDRVKALILNGGNLNPQGVKRTTQLPIEIGYKIAKRFAGQSPYAQKSAEMLGLMVNDPNIERAELSKITVPTLVICGTNDIIREAHTKEIAASIPNAKLSIIKGNHFIAQKRHLAFNQEVERFMQTVESHPVRGNAPIGPPA